MAEQFQTADASLISGKRLARNVIWNGAGELAPLAAAFIAMPILIHTIGTEQFGVLALAWTVFGYFNLFDFGTSFALTKLVSDRLARHADREIPVLIGTALTLMVVLGLIGAVLLASGANIMVARLFRVAPEIQRQVVDGFYILAFSLPICLTMRVLSSVLAAHQRFGVINLVQSPSAAFSSLGPLLVLPYSHSIVALIGVLAAGYLVTWIVYLAMCARTAPRMIAQMRFSRAVVPDLVGFGKWAAGYGVAGTLMMSFDRFVLAALSSMTALSYYVVPGRIMNKLRIVPWSVARVLFPAMSYGLVEDRAKSRIIFERSAKALLLVMFPVVLLLIAFANELLSLWVGAGFAAHSSVLLQWLAVAALLHAVGSAPDELLWAAGRPDVTLKLRSVELPIYLALMIGAVYWRGAEGAAIASAVRCGVEAAAEWVMARVLLPDIARGGRRLAYFTVVAALGLVVAAVPVVLATKIAIVTLELLVLSTAGWRGLLDHEERLIAKRSFWTLTGYVAVDRGAAA